MMRAAILVAVILYVLTAYGGIVAGPFNNNADCESVRHDLGAGGYCLPLWP
jgi:hypothetical protein